MRARVLLSLAALAAAVPLFVAPTDSADAAERHWAAPVSGAPVRLFRLGPNPFLRGQHRGVDLAADSESVRAACAGRVVFAGRVAGAGTVSVRCGGWRVSYAPLTGVRVREGQRIGAGARLGRAARGIHFGVRREGHRFGYVDPLRFLAERRAPPPPVPVPLTVRPPRSLPLHHAAQHGPSLAPWPVWLGLTLLLAGLVGAGRLRLPFRRRARARCRAPATEGARPPSSWS